MDSLRRMPVHVLIMLTMLFGLEMTFSGNQAWADRASCEQIRLACKRARMRASLSVAAPETGC